MTSCSAPGIASGAGTVRKYRRFLQRGRIGGQDTFVRIFQWQRMREKTYPKYEARMLGVMQFLKHDLFDALNDLSAWGKDQSIDISEQVGRAVQDLHQTLEQETPFDPEGPNDPPLHAAEDWKVTIKERGDTRYTISITNRKHYIQFLEMHGGREDHPGANEGGWIVDAFNDFAISIRSMVR